ncbi:MAG: hypothetical protein AB1457_14505 [Chloroflexota bacterium]
MTDQPSQYDSGISIEYVMTLEQRIRQLENQIQQLEQQQSKQQSLLSTVENKLPNTSLLSPKFLTRAFAIWGHVFVAQLIIAIVFFLGIGIIGNLYFLSLLQGF